MTRITSPFFSLDWQDAVKGLLVAVGSAVVAVIGESFNNKQFTLDFTSIWHTAVAAGVAYIGKQLLTPAKSVTPVQRWQNFKSLTKEPSSASRVVTTPAPTKPKPIAA